MASADDIPVINLNIQLEETINTEYSLPNSAYIKIWRVTVATQEFLSMLYKESHLAFYRICEHINKKIPTILKLKYSVMANKQSIQDVHQNLKDCNLEVVNLINTNQFENITFLLEQALR